MRRYVLSLFSYLLIAGFFNVAWAGSDVEVTEWGHLIVAEEGQPTERDLMQTDEAPVAEGGGVIETQELESLWQSFVNDLRHNIY